MNSGKLLRWSVVGMRMALGVIFFWFGALKFTGQNPVYEIIQASFPFLAEGPGNYFLASLETLIGLGLFLNILPKLIHLALISHLLGTFGVFITAPEIMFEPYFPYLTLEGEFVVKNLALAMGGIIVLLYTSRYGTKK
jgi:uncharacterized membrane protein YkgB